ncbi:MAG: hypothetical protein ACFB6R_09195 [Alphaproteobacteria bacterium]
MPRPRRLTTHAQTSALSRALETPDTGRSLVALGLAGLVGGLLLASGLPRLMAESRALAGASAIRALDAGDAVGPGPLQTAIAETGPLALLDARRRAERGAWTVLLANRQPDGPNRDRTLAAATHWLKTGLADAPLDGQYWAYLSEALQMQGLEPHTQVEGLRLAYLLGPRRLNYIEQRLDVAKRVTGSLDDDLAARVRRDVRQLLEYRRLRPFLVSLAGHRQGKIWVDEAFADSPDILRQIRFTRASIASDRVGRPSARP